MPRSNGSSSDTSSGYCSLCHSWDLGGEDEWPPRSKTSGWNGKWVWPRGKGRGGRRSRFKDVFSGKGPDIFVASERSRGPCRVEWSNWRNAGSMLYNIACPCGKCGQLDAPFWARRSPEEKYDFGSRRYCKPQYEHW